MSRIVTYSVKRNEPWSKVCQFFYQYPDAMAQLQEAIPERDKSFNIEAMTVKGLCEAIYGNIPTEIKERCNSMKVQEATMLLNSLSDGIQTFVKFMEDTEFPMTTKQRNLLSGTKKPELEEAFLLTLKDSFTLHSYEDAQKLTVYEYMSARKNAYNEALVSYKQNMEMEMAAARRR